MLDKIYRENVHNFTLSKFEDIIHPESVFGKLLLFRDADLTVRLMNFYNEAEVTNLKSKADI